MFSASLSYSRRNSVGHHINDSVYEFMVYIKIINDLKLWLFLECESTVRPTYVHGLASFESTLTIVFPVCLVTKGQFHGRSPLSLLAECIQDH